MTADLESKVLAVTQETIRTYGGPRALCVASADISTLNGRTLSILIGRYSQWICGYTSV
jgi:hypothetical protein